MASDSSSASSLAVVLDPLPLELVESSVVVSDSSEDSLAIVSSAAPEPGVREPSSKLVSDVAMASDSSEFVVPLPWKDHRSCRSFAVSGSALECSHSHSRSKGSRQASPSPPCGKHKMPTLPSAIPVRRKK